MSQPLGNDGVEQDVYQALTRTFLKLDDFDRRFFAAFGLSARQFWALKHLDEERGLRMVELGQLLLTDKSNVTGIVDRLESIGLATRTAAPNDRRAMLVTLTPKGRQLREAIDRQHQERVRDLMDAVGTNHLHELLAHLDAIGRSLEESLARMERVSTP